jgi:hypothetical protein
MSTTEDIEEYEDFKISKFLYVIQENIERVSTDRLTRFHTSENHEMVAETFTTEHKACESVSLGDFVMVCVDSTTEVFCGRVIKFQKSNSTTKSSKKFKFTSLFFRINNDVEFFLYPRYTVRTNGVLELSVSYNQWFKNENYVCTIHETQVDETGKKISQNICTKLRRHFE